MQPVLNNRTVPVTAQAPLALRLPAQNGLQTGLSLSPPSHDTLSLNSRLSPSAAPALHFGASRNLRKMTKVTTNPKTGLRTGKLDGQMIGPGRPMVGFNLSNANLSKVDLSTARIYNADLSGTDLSEAELHLANLSAANLSGAELRLANFSGADLSSTKLSGATHVPATILDSNIRTNCPAVYNPSNPPTLAKGLTYFQLANHRILPAHDVSHAEKVYKELQGLISKRVGPNPGHFPLSIFEELANVAALNWTSEEKDRLKTLV